MSGAPISAFRTRCRPASLSCRCATPTRRPRRPPGPEPQSAIALNLTLNAPEQVFIRGRGLDAELGGTIHIHGTAAKPIPDGGLHLRRGTFSLVGSTLNFTEGTIDFSGAGIADPSIHFVATSTTATMIATLTISGSAKDPKITLSSVPDMPQDEILAQLLFNTSTSKLSPFQLAEIAAALASLSGATSGFDPLESLRSKFGLDRLSVGSSTNGSPTLEAGSYLARGVYLGAKQSASGGGTQATVQIDLDQGIEAGDHSGVRQHVGDRQHQQRGRRQCRADLSIRVLIRPTSRRHCRACANHALFSGSSCADPLNSPTSSLCRRESLKWRAPDNHRKTIPSIMPPSSIGAFFPHACIAFIPSTMQSIFILAIYWQADAVNY